MRVPVYFLVLLVVFAMSAHAQGTQIPESEFLAKESAAGLLIEKASHRVTRQLEYFEDKDKPGRLAESHMREVLLPDKWRTVDWTNYDGKVSREENIWDGKSLYARSGDGPWKRFSGGSSTDARIESGQVTKAYRYVGKVSVAGEALDLYENSSLRIANKFSATGRYTVRYVRKTLFWFKEDGRLVKKVEDTTIDGQKALSRQTTTVEYDPNISIEAPIK